jgi:hypothetical protein
MRREREEMIDRVAIDLYWLYRIEHSIPKEEVSQCPKVEFAKSLHSEEVLTKYQHSAEDRYTKLV